MTISESSKSVIERREKARLRSERWRRAHQQTMLASAFRARLAEFAIAVAQGIRHARALIERVFGEGAHAIDFLPWRAQLFGLLSRS